MKLKGVRTYALLALVFVIFAGFSLRLMNLQITRGESYRQQADKTTVASTVVTAPRGDILDRYGRVLATNTVEYSVQMERAAFTQKGQLNSTILQVVAVLRQNGISWKDTLPIGNAPYGFSADAGLLRKYLEQTVDRLPSDQKKFTSKQKTQYDADQAADAAAVMQRLRTHFGIDGDVNSADVRTVIGVRYEMEVEGFSSTNPFTIAENVSLATINQLSERSLPGINITEQYQRVYPQGDLAPQVIGTVGPIHSTDDVKALIKAGYQLNDLIGHGGIEQTQENTLRGINGRAEVVMNAAGVVIGQDTVGAAKPGNNIVLTIDADLQREMQNSLAATISSIDASSGGNADKGAGCTSGAAVAVSVKSGEILGMASWPGYNLNTYNQDYSALVADKTNPLYNRAIKGTYRPGSTFKPVTAVSGLMHGVITPTSLIACNGSFLKYASQGYKGSDDASYGNINVVNALGVSSNVFFDTVADRLNSLPQTGSSKYLESTAKALGLGVKTGVELPGEAAGVVSGPSEKSPWYPADAVQSGIGQLDNLYTPLQLASYVAALINGGTRYPSHLIKSVLSNDNSTVLSDNNVKADTSFQIPSDIVGTVMQGMSKVTDDNGTAAAVFANFPIKTGGKTGTPQVVSGGVIRHNGVYIGFAPYNDPQVAIAVVIEKAEWGVNVAPVAADAMNCLFLHTPDSSLSPLPAAAGQLLH